MWPRSQKPSRLLLYPVNGHYKGLGIGLFLIGISLLVDCAPYSECPPSCHSCLCNGTSSTETMGVTLDRPTAPSLVVKKETLFQTDSQFYRIPALLYVAQHHILLAFAEQRVSKADEQTKDIVLRRGKYEPSTQQVQWQEMKVVEMAQLPGHRSMSPCPVYDEVTGTLFLLFIAVEGQVSEQQQISTKTNAVRLCCVTSKDQGETWSSVQDLTDSAIGPAYKQWATFSVGPGHGVQLHDQTLVIPAYAYRILGPQKPIPYAFCFLSDDHGKTWKMGQFIAMGNILESQVAEVNSQGQRVLYCNSRSTFRSRVQAVSQDGGVHFTEVQQINKLVDQPMGCHGSVVGFPNPTQNTSSSADTWLLYSHPTDPLNREDLALYLNRNPLHLADWTKPAILMKGACAYSDLQYMGPGPNGSPQFGCLFEYGNYEEILFVMFTLEQAFPS